MRKHAVIFFSAWAAWAGIPSVAAAEKSSTGFSAYAYYELARYSEIVSTTSELWKDAWAHSLLGGVLFESAPLENLSLRVNFETRSYNTFPIQNRGDKAGDPNATSWETYVEEASGKYRIGNRAPGLEVEAGYFIFKYNPDAKVFGEYLYRSAPYPIILINKFDYAKTKLLGLRLGHSGIPGLQHSLMLTSEFQKSPLYDVSLSYTAAYDAKIVQVGAGVNLFRVLPVRPSWTTPEDFQNEWWTVPAQTFDYTQKNALDTTLTDTIHVQIDSAYHGLGGTLMGSHAAAAVITPSGDALVPNATVIREKPFSFGGVLLEARISVDPLAFGRPAALGDQDLRIYAEGAILGVESYPGLYASMQDRMPFMVGFNLPAFRMLDVLSLEVERLSNPWIPSYENSVFRGYPQPGHLHGIPELAKFHRDDWKWAVYAKRTVAQSLQIIAQVGTDHSRRLDRAGTTAMEIMQNPEQWYSQVRVVGFFK